MSEFMQAGMDTQNKRMFEEGYAKGRADAIAEISNMLRAESERESTGVRHMYYADAAMRALALQTP